MRRIARYFVPILLVAATLDCSESADPGSESDDVRITADITAGTLIAGRTLDVTLTIERLRAFADSMTLSIDDLPPGVTAEFSPVLIGEGTTTSVLTLTATPGASPGTLSLTVRATAPGITPGITTIEITVTSGFPIGYSLLAEPNTVTVPRNTSNSLTILITRTSGFDDVVTLFVTGVPSAITPTLSPAMTSSNTSTLTLTAGSLIVAGSYTVTIHGQVPGRADETATFMLVVPPG